MNDEAPSYCPVCGAAVEYDVVDVTFGDGPVTYVRGRWRCPQGCDPETAP